jgi:hypothetical protein
LLSARATLLKATGHGKNDRISIKELNALRLTTEVSQALEKIGIAVHATQDATSPSHEGGKEFAWVDDHVLLEAHYPKGESAKDALRSATLIPLQDVLDGTIREQYFDERFHFAPSAPPDESSRSVVK